MSLGAQRTDEPATGRLIEEVTSQLGRARALLALAQRFATAMPLEPRHREQSQAAVAEATGLCVAATRSAKANGLYKIADSGLNPSDLRRAVQRGVSEPPVVRPQAAARSPRSAPATPDRRTAPLLAQLDAVRRMNLEGLRWLIQAQGSPEAQWRGDQLVKIAEQLCVITALESKLLGLFVLPVPSDNPAALGRTVCEWATEATRKEIAEE